MTNLRVAVGEDLGVDEIEVRDASGQVCPIVVVEGPVRRSFKRAKVEAGRTRILTVPVEARIVVPYRDGEPIGEFPVVLERGIVNELTVR